MNAASVNKIIAVEMAVENEPFFLSINRSFT